MQRLIAATSTFEIFAGAAPWYGDGLPLKSTTPLSTRAVVFGFFFSNAAFAAACVGKNVSVKLTPAGDWPSTRPVCGWTRKFSSSFRQFPTVMPLIPPPPLGSPPPEELLPPPPPQPASVRRAARTTIGASSFWITVGTFRRFEAARVAVRPTCAKSGQAPQ